MKKKLENRFVVGKIYAGRASLIVEIDKNIMVTVRRPWSIDFPNILSPIIEIDEYEISSNNRTRHWVSFTNINHDDPRYSEYKQKLEDAGLWRRYF